MVMTRDERDRFGDLFQRLMHRTGADDEPPALRLLGHSLLNYLGTSGTDVVPELCEALPFLAAFLDWTRCDTDPAQVAEGLARTPAVRTLSPQMIERRLSARPAERAQRSIARVPQPEETNDAQVDVVAELLSTERRLNSLLTLSEDELRSRLIHDSSALAASLELCEDAAENELAKRLGTAFEDWNHAQPQPIERRQSGAVWMLAGLEADDETPNPLGRDGYDLSVRARGFERGLAQNMGRLELIPAVRAALAFGRSGAGETVELASAEDREAFLRRFDVFRTDAALMQLASALIEARRLCIDYVCGGAPLASMSPWIAYLRGACVELAEVRECTLREAMSYAHYCLHLVNVCDFAAMGPDAFNQKTREALTGLEEELKEFALAGQREGLSDGEADLGRFERARWRRSGEASYLADRLSRLRGAWTMGTTPGPIGAPPRLDQDVSAHSLALIESLVGEAGEADIVSLARLVEQARFHGYQWLEHLEAAHILKLVASAVTVARDLPGVDVSRPFDVDLTPLGRWATDADRGRLNRRILAALLDRRPMGDILNGCAEPSALRRGLVGHCAFSQHTSSQHTSSQHTGSQHTGDQQARLVIQFIADPELKALLELMGTTTTEDDDFHAVLERRLHQMLHRHHDGGARDQDETPAPSLHGNSRPASGEAGL
jgi:hypothetical protein